MNGSRFFHSPASLLFISTVFWCVILTSVSVFPVPLQDFSEPPVIFLSNQQKIGVDLRTWTSCPSFFSNSLHGRFLYWILSFYLGGNLGKKRMAGIDGFEGVKPIDDVRVDVFEMGHHFCNETSFIGRWCGSGWRIVIGDKDGFKFLLWVGLPLCKSCFCLSFRFLDEFFVFLVQWVNKWWIGSDVDSLFQRRDEIPVGSVLCDCLFPFWWNDVLNLICWIWIGRRSCELDEHINIIIQLSFVLPNINLHLLIPHFVRDFTITSWLFSESSFFIISTSWSTLTVLFIKIGTGWNH